MRKSHGDRVRGARDQLRRASRRGIPDRQRADRLGTGAGSPCCRTSEQLRHLLLAADRISRRGRGPHADEMAALAARNHLYAWDLDESLLFEEESSEEHTSVLTS